MVVSNLLMANLINATSLYVVNTIAARYKIDLELRDAQRSLDECRRVVKMGFVHGIDYQVIIGATNFITILDGSDNQWKNISFGDYVSLLISWNMADVEGDVFSLVMWEFTEWFRKMPT